MRARAISSATRLAGRFSAIDWSMTSARVWAKRSSLVATHAPSNAAPASRPRISAATLMMPPPLIT
jgi:hypothetical protein